MKGKHYIPEIEKMDRNMRRMAAVPLEMDRVIRQMAAFSSEIEKMDRNMRRMAAVPLEMDRVIRQMAAFSSEIEKMDRNMRRMAAVPLEMDRAIRQMAAFSSEIEKMQHRRFILESEYTKIANQILPQKVVKAISEPEPSKEKKAEPMSPDDYKDDPYVHVHGIC